MQATTIDWSEVSNPTADHLIRGSDAAFGEQVFHVAGSHPGCVTVVALVKLTAVVGWLHSTARRQAGGRACRPRIMVHHDRRSAIARASHFAIVVTLLLVSAGPSFGRGPWHANASNTPGWQLMTPQERLEHQARVRGFTNYDECRAYQLRHHQLMEERAMQHHLALAGEGRDFCARLKADEASGKQ